MPIWELGSYDTETFLFLSLGLPTFVTPNYHIRPPATLFKKACEKVLNPWPSHLNEAIFDPPAEPLIEEHHGGHTENCPAKLCPSSGPQNPEISSNGCCFGLTRLLSGKKSACQCRRCRSCSFHPWVRKSPWSRKRQTHSSILAWRIPWTEGCIKLDTTEHADACTHSLACTNSKYLG